MLECTYAYSRNFPSSMPFSNFSRVVNQYSLPFCTQATQIKQQTVLLPLQADSACKDLALQKAHASFETCVD